MPSSRRRFLKLASTGALAGGFPSLSQAVSEPYPRVGPSRLRLGLAAYSFRPFFPMFKGKPNPKIAEDKSMTMPDFIRYCAKQNCAAELTSYFFDPKIDDSYLADCRHIAHVNGVPISGTAVGNNFSHPKNSKEAATQMAYVKQWIDRSAILGAPHIRVFAGKHPKEISTEEAERNIIESLEEAGAYAGAKGIFLGIENHDSISTGTSLLRIVKAVDSKWVGVNLDTGNFAVKDPYPDIEACAPYAINVQVKAKLHHGGKRDTDLERVGTILKKTGYQGHVVLEYEETADPYASIPPILDRMRQFCDT
ncbi:sugar phosphate isomerase/epimerase family protein [Haloferula sp.]|uniref:sugar phosphate isomerase/epimerase family protein n=1 Tax=Haloferula sp. TaxID=2497595 RepID=UPI00329D00D4